MDGILVASMAKNKMTSAEIAEALKRQPQLPRSYMQALRKSPRLQWLPYNMFKFALGAGTYKEDERIMGRRLWKEDAALLGETVKLDMHMLSRREGANSN